MQSGQETLTYTSSRFLLCCTHSWTARPILKLGGLPSLCFTPVSTAFGKGTHSRQTQALPSCSLSCQYRVFVWTISSDPEVGNCQTISLGGREHSSDLVKGQVLLQRSTEITKNRSVTSLAIPCLSKWASQTYSQGGQKLAGTRNVIASIFKFKVHTQIDLLSDTKQDSWNNFRVLVRFCSCCFELLRQFSEPLPTWADTTPFTTVQFRPD